MSTIKSDLLACFYRAIIRETLCDAENSTLPVDVDNKETLCDV